MMILLDISVFIIWGVVFIRLFFGYKPDRFFIGIAALFILKEALINILERL